AYGYHLAWEGRPLFREPFEAWANGPVVYDLYDQHRGRYNLQRCQNRRKDLVGGDEAGEVPYRHPRHVGVLDRVAVLGFASE
ncbi:DUF4065 domain-containing protein, partial [Streptomyces sp. A73]|nr:DUF4065 domain-containing protein [Streptomyces sp. A73]